MAKLDWSDVLFGDAPEQQPELIQAQSPIVRPDPIVRPGEERASRPAPRPQPQYQPPPQQRRAPVQAAPQAASVAPPAAAAQAPPVQTPAQPDMKEWLFGEDKPAAAPAPRGPFPGYKDPKDEGWGEMIVNTVKGRQDPRHAALPSFEKAMMDEGNEDGLKRLRAAYPFVATDTGLANIAKHSLGDRFVRHEKDAYGAPILVYKGKDGKEAKAYLNVPGLDSDDVAKGILQAVPYVMTGGPVGALVKGVGKRVLGMGATAGVTSIGNDLTGLRMGTEETPDLTRAAVVAGTAGVFEWLAPVVGAFWRKAVTEPSLYKNGALTPKGQAAAKEAGLDPAQITQELSEAFSKEYARTGNAGVAARSVSTEEFGIPVTQGQLSKDPAQLLTEKGMRYNVYGNSAKDTMQSFDRNQAVALEQAALGGADAKLSVANVINPAKAGTGTRPADAGQSIRTGLQDAKAAAKAEDKAAWGNVGPLAPTPEALAELPAAVGKRLGSLRVDDKITPKAWAMAEDLEGFMSGSVPGAGPKVLNQGAITEIGDMRKRLLSIYKGAQDPTDIAASKAVYDGFNTWIEESAAKALLKGDAGSAAAMRTARDVRKEMMGIFGERDVTGKVTPGRNLMQTALKDAETPEAIIGKLFTVDSGASPKAGTLEALDLIKRGLDKHLPPAQAAGVWNDLRLAHWQSLVQTRAGHLHTPTMMAKRIDQAFQQQGTILQKFYTPEERGLIRRFGFAMRDIAYKDPNPSGSGTAAAFYTGQFGKALFSFLGATNGPVTKILSTIMGMSGIRNAAGGVAASAAIRPGVRTATNPLLGPYGGAVAAETHGR